MKRKIVIANWKMNPPMLADAERLFRSILLSVNRQRSIVKNQKFFPEIVIAPPTPYIAALQTLRKKLSAANYRLSVRLSAQDCFWENSGAYTGEVGPKILKSLGAEYVILGHSERRRYLGETDEMVNKKVIAALHSGLRVVLCVGEPLAVRKKGIAAVRKFVARQLLLCLDGAVGDGQKSKIKRLFIAYEPVWAVSTRRTGARADTPEDAAYTVRFIKRILNSKFYILNSRVLYGGSVTSGNIGDFLAYDEIDGFLIGSASLKTGEFRKIINMTTDF